MEKRGEKKVHTHSKRTVQPNLRNRNTVSALRTTEGTGKTEGETTENTTSEGVRESAQNKETDEDKRRGQQSECGGGGGGEVTGHTSPRVPMRFVCVCEYFISSFSDGAYALKLYSVPEGDQRVRRVRRGEGSGVGL